MNATQQTPNEIDRLLSGFFKSEMPDPFPPFRNSQPLAASRYTREERRSTSSSRSRFALAASVAILLGGCWYLSGQIGTQSDRPNVGNGDGSANMPKEIKKAMKDAGNKPMMP